MHCLEQNCSMIPTTGYNISGSVSCCHAPDYELKLCENFRTSRTKRQVYAFSKDTYMP